MCAQLVLAIGAYKITHTQQSELLIQSKLRGHFVEIGIVVAAVDDVVVVGRIIMSEILCVLPSKTLHCKQL